MRDGNLVNTGGAVCGRAKPDSAACAPWFRPMPNTCRGVGDGEPRESGAYGSGSGSVAAAAQSTNPARRS
jgi:hypothetical protein